MIRLVAVVSLVAAGCAPAAMSVESYADAMENIADGYVTESQSLSARYQASVEDDVRAAVADDPGAAEERVVEIAADATVNYLAFLDDAMGRFIGAMGELQPPGEVEAAHDEFVSAVTSVRDALPDTRDAVAQADSLSSVRLALTASGFADGQIRWTVSCTALEETVRRQGTGLDMSCVRREVAP